MFLPLLSLAAGTIFQKSAAQVSNAALTAELSSYQKETTDDQIDELRASSKVSSQNAKFTAMLQSDAEAAQEGHTLDELVLSVHDAHKKDLEKAMQT